MSIPTQVLRCFRCQRNEPHVVHGVATERTFVEGFDGDAEDGEPHKTGLLQCRRCELISLWTIERSTQFIPRKGKPSQTKIIETAVRCRFRDMDAAAAIDFPDLPVDKRLADSLSQRWQDTQKCLSLGAWLGAIILMGSILEGVLLAVIRGNMRTAMTSDQAPRDRSGTTRPLEEWTLEAMIEVACGAGWLTGDIRDYCKTIRELRNFVHPNLHAASGLEISEATCMISWHALQGALQQLEAHLPTRAQRRRQ